MQTSIMMVMDWALHLRLHYYHNNTGKSPVIGLHRPLEVHQNAK